ncbi:peptidoglycan DD-metalloendopeptidase family protein [Legionella micdadei]|uniref:peptidoglycan DD-metalloendopeptidase family protein n=1 Tax=Legionella micdadei TaxID=451 RepID=UPI0009EF70D1|nr:peptidoglycan DD-metalloendopeptidase family protein [Legionella micdadei]ARG99943.1 peptidase [Legionella micdadei]
MYKLCVLALIILLTACTTRQSLAPVVELKWKPHNPNQTTHIVQRGETLYAVAFRYDLDYRQLAAINRLHRPYALRVGQVLRVRGIAPRTQFLPAKPMRIQQSVTRAKPNKYFYPKTRQYRSVAAQGQHWIWPVNGRVAARFAPQQGKKGIDIAGKKGEKIRASSGGVVAYAGSGLSGYGNLIIIKHNDQYLTAYGNNSKNIVKEGQSVKAGQIIAEMGVIDRKYWGVHFEIRKAGKPVNPLDYLKG